MDIGCKHTSILNDLNLFFMWGEDVEEINKNDIRIGNVIDLTHEGHGVVKIDRYQYLFLMS